MEYIRTVDPWLGERLDEIRPRPRQLVVHPPPAADPRRYSPSSSESMILRKVMHHVEGRGLASAKSGMSTERGSAGSR
jgi:hypothetical protein